MLGKSEKGLEKVGLAITNATETRGVSPRAAILTSSLENFYIASVCGASHPSGCSCTAVLLVLSNFVLMHLGTEKGGGSPRNSCV